jgi:hypothetical protein
MGKWRRVTLALTGVVSGTLLLATTAFAASSANISHAYKASESIPSGSLVSVRAGKSDYVELANSRNGSKLLGLAVSSSDSLLAVDPDSGTVQVATSGTATALVSDVNGDISVGDQVSVSPFSGIGMKSLPGTRIIGVAQTAFSASTTGSSTKDVQDKSGKTQQIHVGYVRVTIGVGSSNSTDGSEQLNSLQKLIKSLTGKTISTWRIIIALIVAIIALAALIALIYASIFGSIISVGRNPLAKHAIFRTLTSVVVMACVMAAVAAATIFFLLQ